MFIRFLTLALTLGLFHGSAFARSTSSIRCNTKDWHFDIEDVGPRKVQTLLPPGIYISFTSGVPWHRTVTIFRVRADENSVRELMVRVDAQNQRYQRGDYSQSVSFEGIRFSAVGVDARTTSDGRGSQVLLVEGSTIRIGDSGFGDGAYDIGKYTDDTLEYCH